MKLSFFFLRDVFCETGSEPSVTVEAPPSAPSHSVSQAFTAPSPSSAAQKAAVRGSGNLETSLCLPGLLYLSLLLSLCGSQVSLQARWKRACKFSFTAEELTDVADCIF